jgi:hypothetical protein
MDEVDVEGARELPEGCPKAEAADATDAEERVEVSDQVGFEALQLGRDIGEPVAREVHLVAPLPEPPTPAKEVDRAPVPNAEDPERFRRHVAEC